MNKFLWLEKFGELLLRDVDIATNFVAPNGDKLAWNAFFVCDGILQWLGISQNLYHIETTDVPSTPCKNFVNFGAVNHWDVLARLQEVGAGTHAKIRTFA